MNNTGWICPRCGKVNAPDVKQCSCKQDDSWKKYEPYIPPDVPLPIVPYGPIWIYNPPVYYSDNVTVIS